MSRKRASETVVVESNSHSFDQTDNYSDYDINGSSSNSITNKKIPRRRPKLRVSIKRWHGIAHWTWNCGETDDVCGICQSEYEGVAPGGKFPGDECPVVWGKCHHCFHLQCINKWLETKTTCPICRSEWEYSANGGLQDDEGEEEN